MDTLYSARLHGFTNLGKGPEVESALSEQGILSLLIVLGSSISLVGLVFAFITYSLFSDLRNLSGTTLMNLLAALFMTQLLYVVGVGGVPDPELCISLALSLQYVRLCVLCWLLVILHHMYQQFSTHLHTLIPRPDVSISERFLRYSLFAWGLPALLLVLSLFLQYTEKSKNLLNTTSLTGHNCWFLDKWAFYICFMIPAVVLFLISLWYITCSISAVYKAVSIQLDKKIRDKMFKKRRLQIVLFIQVTVVIYIGVLLGGLYKHEHSELYKLSYHIIQGLQGIIIAMLVTCNCQVVKLYSKSISIKRKKRPCIYGTSGNINKSTSMQLLTWESPPDIV